MVFGDAIFHEIEGLQALRVQSEAQADDQGALPAEADPSKAAFSSPRGRVACARNSPSTQAMSQLLYMEVCRRFQELRSNSWTGRHLFGSDAPGQTVMQSAGLHGAP